MPRSRTSIDVHVGQRLRLGRLQRGLSQESLGSEVGVSFQQIQKYEKGSNRIGAGKLYEFARVLGVDVGYFYEDLPTSQPRFSEERLTPPTNTDLLILKKLSGVKSATLKRRLHAVIDALTNEEPASGPA